MKSTRREGEGVKYVSGKRWAAESRHREQSRRSKEKTARGEGDQRHVEFTITLLGCTVIKAKSPGRERRLEACPVSSLAPLISCMSPTETHRLTFRKAFFHCARSPIGSEESAKQAQIVMAPAPLDSDKRRSASDEPLPGSSRSFLMF